MPTAPPITTTVPSRTNTRRVDGDIGSTPQFRCKQIRLLSGIAARGAAVLVRRDNHVVEVCFRPGLIGKDVGDVRVKGWCAFAIRARVVEFDGPLLRLGLAAFPDLTADDGDLALDRDGQLHRVPGILLPVEFD